MIYLDNSATTRVMPAAAAAALTVMNESFGNPSSLHRAGIAAEHIVDDARKIIADSLKALPEEIVFTSGATESNNTAIFGAAQAGKRTGLRIITTAIEHPSVSRCFDKLAEQGFEVVRLAPENGKISEEQLAAAMTSDTILTSMMAVNNETGDVLPIGCVKDIIKKCGSRALFHCDAVQGYGKIDLCPKRQGIDLLSISGHKLYAPKGIGALYIAKGVRIPPLLLGGGQEAGMRSGTENTPAIAGFGAAVKNVFENHSKIEEHFSSLHAYLKNKIQNIEGVLINSPECAVNYIMNISLLGCRSETVLHMLEEKEIYISSGSACSAKSKKASSVLASYGFSAARADSALRISFGLDNTEKDVDELVQALIGCRKRLVRGA